MVTFDSTRFPNAQSTVGIDCPRMKLMPRQSMDSRTVYREEGNVRWTSSWTNCPQVQIQWLHEIVLVIDWSSIRLIVPEVQPHPLSPGKHTKTTRPTTTTNRSYLTNFVTIRYFVLCRPTLLIRCKMFITTNPACKLEYHYKKLIRRRDSEREIFYDNIVHNCTCYKVVQ